MKIREIRGENIVGMLILINNKIIWMRFKRKERIKREDDPEQH